MPQAETSILIITIIITIVTQAGCTSVKQGIEHPGAGNNPGWRH